MIHWLHLIWLLPLSMFVGAWWVSAKTIDKESIAYSRGYANGKGDAFNNIIPVFKGHIFKEYYEYVLNSNFLRFKSVNKGILQVEEASGQFRIVFIYDEEELKKYMNKIIIGNAGNTIIVRDYEV